MCVLTKVKDLIDPITGQWDEVLVREIFWEMDANLILSTPIREDFNDFPAWHFDTKGIFSVKSAYRIYIKKRDANTGSSSAQQEEKMHWKKIWALPCLPKIKQFVWRLAHNSLPLMMSIKRRGIECDTRCVCCQRLDEDGGHLFLKCKEMKELWEKLGMPEFYQQLCSFETAQDVIQQILLLDDEKRVLICCMLWQWWQKRNKQNKEGKIISTETVWRQARYWTAECMQFCGKKRKEAVQTQIQHWQRPEGERLKINTDGAFSSETRQGGWGFVVRDNMGDARGSGAGAVSHACSALQMEAHAIWEAAHAAADWGMGRIILETDSLTLVRVLLVG
jgi:hypothetical protein